MAPRRWHMPPDHSVAWFLVCTIAHRCIWNDQPGNDLGLCPAIIPRADITGRCSQATAMQLGTL